MPIHPRCFFDIEIDGHKIGRLVFELFSSVVPKTCDNFLALCTGELGNSPLTGVALHYKGSYIHRIVKGFMVQGGDITRGNGTGGESIYEGGAFEDENFLLKHEQPYLLSMANRGPDTNTSQFLITTRTCPNLNGKHIVFGRLVSGFDILEIIEAHKTDENERPFVEIIISNCGELELQKDLVDPEIIKKYDQPFKIEQFEFEVSDSEEHKSENVIEKDKKKRREKRKSSEKEYESDENRKRRERKRSSSDNDYNSDPEKRKRRERKRSSDSSGTERSKRRERKSRENN